MGVSDAAGWHARKACARGAPRTMGSAPDPTRRASSALYMRHGPTMASDAHGSGRAKWRTLRRMVQVSTSTPCSPGKPGCCSPRRSSKRTARSWSACSRSATATFRSCSATRAASWRQTRPRRSSRSRRTWRSSISESAGWRRRCAKRASSPRPRTGVVSVGRLVEVEYQGSGRVVAYHVTGSALSAGPGSLSAGSPVGRALMGRVAGDVVAVDLPTGRVEHLRVLAVRAE